MRDNFKKLTELGVKIFGVSSDSAESHKAFIDKHDLPFPLVVDEDAKVAGMFGVPSTAGFLSRQSILIDKDGKVRAIWRDVDPATHADQVIKAAGG